MGSSGLQMSWGRSQTMSSYCLVLSLRNSSLARNSGSSKRKLF